MMFSLSNGAQEYLYTIGSVSAFVGMLATLFLARKDVAGALAGLKLRRRHLLAMLAVLALFVGIEFFMVSATQQLFFDDAIYQGMALDLLHTGQAWMCDYGTPVMCYVGEIFHEPVGTALNLAIGFAGFGVSRAAAYGTEFALSGIAVLFTFLVALLFLKDVRGALFAELFMALSPMLLIWAKPTTSDIPMFAYSLIAMFALLVFINRRNVRTMAFALLALAFLLYTKVDAAMYLPVMLVVYILLSDGGVAQSVRRNARRVYESLFNTKVLVVALVFVLLIAPELNYSLYELNHGNYGYEGAPVVETCTTPMRTTTAAASISIANFRYNVCANVFFWFNYYKNAQMPQPIIFTAFALLGAAVMAVYGKRRELGALAVWFLAFFLLYTAFYAGGVDYGVDWRFMLTVIAPVAIMGGAGASYIIRIAGSDRIRRARLRVAVAAKPVAAIAVLALIVVAFSSAIPAVTVNPANIQQAGDARFYENFVYNSTATSIPKECIVYTYDPTLFNINGRAAAQISNLYNTTYYQKLNAQYGCSVLDYGYWCGTPNNICGAIMNMYNLTPIANATYRTSYRTFTYGLYMINGPKTSG